MNSSCVSGVTAHAEEIVYLFGQDVNDLFIILLTVCIVLAFLLSTSCGAVIIVWKRSRRDVRIKRTKEFIERRFAERYESVLLHPNESGRFKRPLFCSKCKKKFRKNAQLCIHFQRMLRFIELEKNIKFDKEILAKRVSEVSAPQSKPQSKPNATVDLSQIMQEFPYGDTTCSMLYSACECSTSEDETTKNNANKSGISRRSFVANFLEPFVHVAKKFSSFSARNSSRSPCKSALQEQTNNVQTIVFNRQRCMSAATSIELSSYSAPTSPSALGSKSMMPSITLPNLKIKKRDSEICSRYATDLSRHEANNLDVVSLSEESSVFQKYSTQHADKMSLIDVQSKMQRNCVDLTNHLHPNMKIKSRSLVQLERGDHQNNEEFFRRVHSNVEIGLNV